MENKKAEVFFLTRQPDDRRRVGGRRLFRKQEGLDHNSERRVNMIKRRMLGDRREFLPEVMNTFQEVVL